MGESHISRLKTIAAMPAKDNTNKMAVCCFWGSFRRRKWSPTISAALRSNVAICWGVKVPQGTKIISFRVRLVGTVYHICGKMARGEKKGTRRVSFVRSSRYCANHMEQDKRTHPRKTVVQGRKHSLLQLLLSLKQYKQAAEFCKCLVFGNGKQGGQLDTAQ